MERGYLIACLAIVTTFAGLSTGFRSLEHAALFRIRHFGVNTGSRCPASSAAQAAAKAASQLQVPSAEEAQLLAEMNLPLAEMQVNTAQQMARRDVARAQCARARALQDAQRASQNMIRLRQNLKHSSQISEINPL